MMSDRLHVGRGLGRNREPAKTWHSPGGTSLIVLLALAAGGAARAECPMSTVTARSNFGGTVTHTTSMPRDGASRYDQGSHCLDYCYSWYVDSDAGYDLVAGTMYAYAHGTGAGLGD